MSPIVVIGTDFQAAPLATIALRRCMTSLFRLTRSALKRFNADGLCSGGTSAPPAFEDPRKTPNKTADPERLVTEYHEFQQGETSSKRRRVSRSSGSERRTETTTSETSENNELPIAELTLAKEEKRLEGAPEGELYVVTVLTREEIKPSTELESEIDLLHAVLTASTSSMSTKSSDHESVSWAREYAAIDTIRRLAIHHREKLDEVLDQVLTGIVCPSAVNLRSAMARNALLCIQDIVLCLGSDASRHFDEFIPLLLGRTVNEKQFIRDLAREGLDACLGQCAGEQLLRNLLQVAAVEKNAQVVSCAGVYASKCVDKMDKTVLKSFVTEGHESFFEDMSTLLNCKVVECKAATRKTLQHVRAACGEKEFTEAVKSKLSGTAQFEVLKASEERKPVVAKSGIPKLSMRERMMQMKRQQHEQLQRGDALNDVEIVVSAPAPRVTIESGR
ncbi:hypothetical protein Poli38472_014204 [Pythium oligandrum]|uniref:TOG domain-containing protein n=1 Tax=Pythium oligandrum TaxID=41045 RepID=A0A8K1CIK9_PYTOL|nr:hypothetical protein Poli38472_014204 [Pythium oligandrum]|eukprot:TMW64087.1 hypothetical protein Poli38472_014204 [Pythium oligandrum]